MSGQNHKCSLTGSSAQNIRLLIFKSAKKAGTLAIPTKGEVNTYGKSNDYGSKQVNAPVEGEAVIYFSILPFLP